MANRRLIDEVYWRWADCSPIDRNQRRDVVRISCGEGVFPSSDADALSSECSHVNEFSSVSLHDLLLISSLQRVKVGVEHVRRRQYRLANW